MDLLDQGERTQLKGWWARIPFDYLGLGRMINPYPSLFLLNREAFVEKLSTQGKSVTFGVRRGCIAVAGPVLSITWLISP